MTLFGSYSRSQFRQTFSEAWRKHVAGSPLGPLEAMIADVIGLHPEYQAAILEAATAPDCEVSDAQASENPFLHMGLHMAVREQLCIDRPPGVRDLHRRLQTRSGDAHDAEHQLMEALAETLWEAQRAGKPPDETQYLALARNRRAAADSI